MNAYHFVAVTLMLLSTGMASAIDLNAPPATPPVSKEESKTADQITSPITDSISNYRGFQLPAHQSQCYTPKFTVLNRSIVMDWHCVQLEKHRALLSLLFLTSWALTVFTIIMSA
jgi:hypothetical protein